MRTAIFRAAIAAVALLAAAVPSATAQEESPVGARVRVTSAGAPPDQQPVVRIGQLQQVDPAWIELKLSQDLTTRVDRGGVLKVERSKGRPSRAKRAIWGLAVGFAVGFLWAGSEIGAGDPYVAAEAVLYGGLLLGAVGAGIGAALPTDERWKEIDVRPPEPGPSSTARRN